MIISLKKKKRLYQTIHQKQLSNNYNFFDKYCIQSIIEKFINYFFLYIIGDHKMVSVSLTKEELYFITDAIANFKAPSTGYAYNGIVVLKKFLKNFRGNDRIRYQSGLEDFIAKNNLKQLVPKKGGKS